MNGSSGLADSFRDVLQQGADLLGALEDGVYGEKVPVAYGSSIGGHYRHCLEHFEKIIDLGEGTELDYDQRRRDPRLETDRAHALARTNDYLTRIQDLTGLVLQRPIRVRCQAADLADEAGWVESTLAREIMYVVAHAVHHYALIGVISGLQGTSLPPRFGVAPSTLQHQERMGTLNKLAA